MSSANTGNYGRKRPGRVNRNAFLASLALIALPVLAKAWPL
jgi:hypothetical protein